LYYNNIDYKCETSCPQLGYKQIDFDKTCGACLIDCDICLPLNSEGKTLYWYERNCTDECPSSTSKCDSAI
jgi:hypothetical protein